MDQRLREILDQVEQLELDVHRERDPEIDGLSLMDPLAAIRQDLRSYLGLDPFRDLTKE